MEKVQERVTREEYKFSFSVVAQKINLLFIFYSAVILCSIVVAFFIRWLKIRISKDSFLLGIAFLKERYFLFPFILFFLIIGLSFIQFTYYPKQASWIDSNDRSFWKFLTKFKFFFFFNNLAILMTFYSLLYLIFIPLDEEYEFKLSTSVLSVTFSGNILTNLNCVVEEFLDKGISPRIFHFCNNIAYFLLFHNAYFVFWSGVIEHTFAEIVLAHLVSLLFLIVLNMIPFHTIFKRLLSSNVPKIKEKNIICFNETY